jgi:hypothetical protein
MAQFASFSSNSIKDHVYFNWECVHFCGSAYTYTVIRSELCCSGATCTNSLRIMNEAKGTLPISSFFVLT